MQCWNNPGQNIGRVMCYQEGSRVISWNTVERCGSCSLVLGGKTLDVESSGKQEPKTRLASRSAVPRCSSSPFQDPKMGLRRSWSVSEHVRTSLGL